MIKMGKEEGRKKETKRERRNQEEKDTVVGVEDYYEEGEKEERSEKNGKKWENVNKGKRKGCGG